ncbi:MFS transporter [Polaromonas sp. C04]|uniref:MFS transporter n=1 Tax=Polaromonas sp. C04 TaxID=1945857 RepID=UPI0009844FFE|nr:MFS transporter [Polaromonas sp. C04]OOG58001.1 hypothetical protein B0E49_03955 [Polaromonas sp. C04]
MNAFTRHPIALIAAAQLFGTSLWFSPNSAAESLAREWSLTAAQLGQLTSAVQVGFIVGSLLLATSGVADRYSASRVFALASLLGAAFNAAFAFLASSFTEAMVLRFLVGICLGGIYPLGMKMVIAWTKGSTGSALGLLVGMLTLGTALPHAVRAAGADLPWQGVVVTSSILALLGGAAVLFLGDGPNLSGARGEKSMGWGAALRVFSDRNFLSCAMGYFGHMWELYAFWTVVPFLVTEAVRGSKFAAQDRIVSSLSFAVIAAGMVGCVVAGHLSNRFGSARTAAAALGTSGSLCLMYPFLAHLGFVPSVALLLIWGFAVIADSAQFSAIASRVCPPEVIGSALAIQNSVGFLVTVGSITLVTSVVQDLGSKVGWLLIPGPVIGLLFFRRLVALPSEYFGPSPVRMPASRGK